MIIGEVSGTIKERKNIKWNKNELALKRGFNNNGASIYLAYNYFNFKKLRAYCVYWKANYLRTNNLNNCKNSVVYQKAI